MPLHNVETKWGKAQMISRDKEHLCDLVVIQQTEVFDQS
jgi:hypothetical protein